LPPTIHSVIINLSKIITLRRDRVASYPTADCDWPAEDHAPGNLIRFMAGVPQRATEDGQPRPPLPVAFVGQFCELHEGIGEWLARTWPVVAGTAAM
jgi:hypothetical protein